MGVAIGTLLEAKEIKLEDLSGKVLAVDAFNTLYMFLTTIRGPDGSPLTDSKGRITSHLVGLFSRFSNLLEKGIKFVFVFDGEAPELKKEEKERRKSLKLEASKLYEEAKDKEDVQNMKKYAARTAFLTKDMVFEAKELISAMGIPFIEAPSEGEAQAAFMVRQGDAFAVMSQDADALVSGATRWVRNVSISGKRKLPGSLGYKNVVPELIVLQEVTKSLNLNQDELIVLAILVGTDYNYGGVKGIGPKKALKLLEKHKGDFDAVFLEAKWSESFETDWKKIFNTIKNIPVSSDYKIEFKKPDSDKIKSILVNEYEFSSERVDSVLVKLETASKLNEQKGLSDFF